MSLSVGDIFEGVYQLEERVREGDGAHSTRWRADDVTAYRRVEVLIDTLPRDYDPQLYWYGKVEGLRKIGQSAENSYCYVVWELDRAQSLLPVKAAKLNEREKQRLDEQIDALPVAAHETISPDDLPEVWWTETGEFLIFYHKYEGEITTFKQKQKVRERWKRNLHQSPEDLTDPLPAPTQETDEAPVNPTSTKWSLLTIGLGIILILVVYQAIPPKPSASLTSFQISLDRGIAEAKKGSYESALEHFEAAAAAPEDDETDARLDSLAGRYRERARRECDRYRAAGSTNLYFIPNQYFKYAAVLSRRSTPEICQ